MDRESGVTPQDIIDYSVIFRGSKRGRNDGHGISGK
jgi:hypothetical protein